MSDAEREALEAAFSRYCGDKNDGCWDAFKAGWIAGHEMGAEAEARASGAWRGAK